MKKDLIPLLVAILMASCQPNENTSMRNKDLPPAPDVEKKDSVLTMHDDSRVDPYFWMRLTDEQKSASEPDAQTQKVLDYLAAENDYTEAGSH